LSLALALTIHNKQLFNKPLYHSLGSHKTHDWSVDQLADLFHTTHKVKTQQVVRNRGQRCGDIEYLHYPNDIDRSLNETDTDKIRKYHSDYNNNPSSCISLKPAIASTSGRLHSEFVFFLFLQTHRETDRFFASSGVQLPRSTSDQFHYKRVVLSSQVKSKVDNILVKAVTLRIILNNIDGSPVTSRSHTHPSHSQTSRLLTSSMSLGVPVPHTTQCM
jgi:hypothetical protein